MVTEQVMKEEVFPLMGVEKLPEIEMLGKENKQKDQLFTNDEHAQVFTMLSEGSKYVKFTKMLPYLMLFFLKHLMCGLDKRRRHYDEMLNPKVRTSLYACFLRVGLNPEDFDKQTITYR